MLFNKQEERFSLLDHTQRTRNTFARQHTLIHDTRSRQKYRITCHYATVQWDYDYITGHQRIRRNY